MTLKQASVSEAGRLDVVAAAVFELSRSRAATLIKQGAVSVAGVLHTRPSFQVELGALLRIELPPAEPDQALPEELPLSIVYEDDDLIVVDKASGMVVHPGPGHSGGTLVNALLFHIDTLSGIGGVLRPGIVHRLDKGTSGLMVVAKNDAAHQGLSEQFAAHSAGRRYLAICFGRARQDAGRAESYLARHPKDRVRIASTDGSYGKHAVTHWELLGQAELACLIECRLETGRTHQVRVHLTEMGCPLIGDSLYRRK
ncbi:MAG TPA: RluA family pseudouridine synthase, partial [Planctomycetes bacterium]|nr:RluA family pseudouridine synthase [Planctomycetota bacterium]